MSKKISELVTAPTLEETDLFEIAKSNGGGFVSLKCTLNAIAIKILTGISFANLGNKTVVNAITGTVLQDTLEAGETTLTFTDAALTSSSTLDFYTDTFGVNPTAAALGTGTLTLTFEEQAADVEVKVRVS